MFFSCSCALFVIRPAVLQAAEKRFEGCRQDGGRIVLGINVDAPRLADTVVEHDCVVPGRRGPADDDARAKHSVRRQQLMSFFEAHAANLATNLPERT